MPAATRPSWYAPDVLKASTRTSAKTCSPVPYCLFPPLEPHSGFATSSCRRCSSRRSSSVVMCARPGWMEQSGHARLLYCLYIAYTAVHATHLLKDHHLLSCRCCSSHVAEGVRRKCYLSLPNKPGYVYQTEGGTSESSICCVQSARVPICWACEKLF